MKIKIPFYLQTTTLNCGPVALKMVLEFLGEKYSIEEMEKLTGIQRGKVLYTIQLATTASKLGFKTEFFSKILGINPENLEMDFYKRYSSLQLSDSERIFMGAKEAGVELQERTLLLEEIIANIKDDRAILVLLDWNVVKGQEEKGYQGHFVPITGFDSKNIYVHNHGFHNPQAYSQIKKEILEKARKAKGTDEDIVIIHRK